jgi:hypothetical protein
MAGKKPLRKKNLWKVTVQDVYSMDRDERINLVFENLIPEKSICLAPLERSLEDEDSTDRAVCPRVKRKASSRGND